MTNGHWRSVSPENVYSFDNANINVLSINVINETIWKAWHASEIFDILGTDNYFWLATSSGLEKRDAESGVLLELINKKSGLPGNVITSLADDYEGGLWLAVTDSLFCGNSTLVHLDSGGTIQEMPLPDNATASIIELYSDRPGEVWLGTSDRGAFHYYYGNWEVFDTSNSPLLSNHVSSIVTSNYLYPFSKHTAIFGGSELWIGTFKGLYHRKVDYTWDVFLSSNSDLGTNITHALTMDTDGGLWMGTPAGLYYYKDGVWTSIDSNDSPLPLASNINFVESDGEGGVWINTGVEDIGLLHRLEDGSWESFTTDNSTLPSNVVTCMDVDRSNNLWVVSGGFPVKYSSDGKWKTYHVGFITPNTEGARPDYATSSNCGKYINAIISDGDNGTWVGSTFGLQHLSGGILQNYTTENSDIPSNYITALALDDSGVSGPSLWVGTLNGLAFYTPNTNSWQNFTTENSGLPSNSITALELDQNGDLWIGTKDMGIAIRHQDDTWDQIGCDNNDTNITIPDCHVTSLELDGVGGMWVGTFYGGLTHIDQNGTITTYRTAGNGTHLSPVLALASDKFGGLWIGTPYNGLIYRSQGGNWTELLNYIPESGNWIDSLFAPNEPDVQCQALFIGSKTEGLMKFDYCLSSNGTPNGTLDQDLFNSQLLNAFPIEAITKVGNSQIWIGTWGAGAIKVSESPQGNGNDNPFVMKSYARPHFYLPDAYIAAIEPGDDDNVWIGTQNGVIELSMYMNDSKMHWRYFNPENSPLPGKYVSAISKDGQGGIWIGSNYWTEGWTATGALAHLKGDGIWDVFSHANSDLPDDLIQAVKFDSLYVWVGTENSGIAKCELDGRCTIFDTFNSGIPSNKVNDILIDSPNAWLATENGLVLMKNIHTDSPSWIVFNTTNSQLPTNSTTVIEKGRPNTYWIGVGGGKLVKLMYIPGYTPQWTVFTPENSGLPENIGINALVSDGGNGVWIGLENFCDVSLVHFDGLDKWTVYDTKNSLVNDSVYSLARDGSKLWIGVYGTLLLRFSSTQIPGIDYEPTDVVTGIFPLQVEFSGISNIEDIAYWLWDFDGDGVPDLDGQDHTWRYWRTGSITPYLTVIKADGTTDIILKPNNIIVEELSDLDADGDVDGLDLWLWSQASMGINVQDVAGNFGTVYK